MDSTSESGSRSERQGLSGELVVDLDGITIDELARAPRNVAPCQGVVISQTFAVLDHEIGGEGVVSSAKRHPHLGQVSPIRTRALTRSLSRVFVSRSPERESGASPRHYLAASDEDGISEHGSDVDRLYHSGSENCLRDDQVSRGVQITGDILEDDGFRPAQEQSRPGRGSTCFTFSRPSHLPPSTSTTVKGKARRSLSQTRYSLRGKTSGELKKMLSGPTGLHHEDQKLLFKDKERDSKTFLDIVGVKNKSKIVLIEDPISQEKRHIEMRKKAKQEKALKSISEISLEVDRLAGKVSMLESIMSKGGKVVEKDLLSLTEHLMNQLLNLDGIIGDGDVKLQREMQVKRVQKYVESLDMLKLKNSTSTSNGTKIPKQHTPIQQQQTPPPKYSNGHISSLNQHQQPHNFIGSLQNQTRAKQDHSSNHSPSTSVVITTQWETFDVGPSIVYAAPKFNWDLL